MKIHDIVFIGAGASALMASCHLQGRDVALIDANPKVGAKILISGGGKCNLTNRFASSENYFGDKTFIEKALKHKIIFDGRNIYSPEQMKEFGYMYYGIGRKDN